MVVGKGEIWLWLDERCFTQRRRLCDVCGSFFDRNNTRNESIVAKYSQSFNSFRGVTVCVCDTERRSCGIIDVGYLLYSTLFIACTVRSETIDIQYYNVIACAISWFLWTSTYICNNGTLKCYRFCTHDYEIIGHFKSPIILSGLQREHYDSFDILRLLHWLIDYSSLQLIRPIDSSSLTHNGIFLLRSIAEIYVE